MFFKWYVFILYAYFKRTDKVIDHIWMLDKLAYVQNIVDGINVTMGAIGKVPQIMGTILNFPEPLTALLIFGVTCTIILAIFRR